MQVEVVPLSESAVSDEDIVPVSVEPASTMASLDTGKKPQEKSLKIDFSAFWDCV